MIFRGTLKEVPGTTGRRRSTKRHWLAEVPAFDITSQGDTKEEAINMVCEAIELASGKFTNFEVTATASSRCDKHFRVTSTDARTLTELYLQRSAEKMEIRRQTEFAHRTPKLVYWMVGFNSFLLLLAIVLRLLSII